MVKTYTLAVNVFNGGERFAKTLASIEKVHTLFDVVYISITETEKSNSDFENCKKFKIPNLEINKYSEPGCKNHFINTIQNLNTDFVLFLGHDDICHEDGIIEAKKFLDVSDGSVAFYGSNLIQDENVIQKQVILEYDKVYSSSDFILKRISSEFYLNVSGIFNSVASLQRTIPLMLHNSESYWLDMIAITTPYTKIIKQTKNPICTIHFHETQMSKNVTNFENYCKDGIWFHFFTLFFESNKKRIPLYFYELKRIGSYIKQKSFINFLISLLIKSPFSKYLYFDRYFIITLFIMKLNIEYYISNFRIFKFNFRRYL